MFLLDLELLFLLYLASIIQMLRKITEMLASFLYLVHLPHDIDFDKKQISDQDIP